MTRNRKIFYVAEAEQQIVAYRDHPVATQQQRSALLLDATAEWLGCDRGGLHAERTPAGRPTVDGAPVPVHASLARRGAVALVGLARRPIGVDLEPVGEPQPVPWNVLAATERVLLASIASERDRHLAFLRLWTVKEAVLKALGKGLSREPADIAVAFDQDPRPQVSIDGQVLVPTFARCAVTSDPLPLVWAGVIL